MLTIKHRENKKYYSIGWNDYVMDESVAHYLNLSLSEYRDILRTCGGCNVSKNASEMVFNNSEDVEMAITVLEPYAVMAKLMG